MSDKNLLDQILNHISYSVSKTSRITYLLNLFTRSGVLDLVLLKKKKKEKEEEDRSNALGKTWDVQRM